MKRIAFSLVFVVNSIITFTQIPQGFNYQAVAHNSAGAPIMNTTIQVKAGILSDTLKPLIVWEELHASVKTNTMGVFSLVIGTGQKLSGSASSFSTINWIATPLYLKIQIYYQNSWKYMGTSKLWSVPYAMASGGGTDVSGLQNEINAIETGAGLNDNGTYTANSSSNYLKLATNLKNADDLLDTKVKSLDGSVTTNTSNISALTVEVNSAETGAGLNNDGTYTANTSANYISTASSLKDADNKLDTQVKNNSDRIATNSTKLLIKGTEPSPDTALFRVVNKNGQTVFAVYNEGVRVYVDDGLVKTRKGGFIISGFNQAKEIVQDYFVVNSDSIRAYIDSNPEKTRKGGFAVASFDKTKANIQDYLRVSSDSIRMFIDDEVKTRKGGFAVTSFNRAKGEVSDYFNIATNTTDIIDPSENRILWYPLKNSFLTGRVLVQKSDSVGENSFASGYESKAIGNYSQALGYKAIARGDYSTAIGKNAIANNINSFAFGDSAKAINDEGYAIGRGAIAKGYRSFAFGSAGIDSAGNVTDVARALGDYSFAIGQGSQALGIGAFAIGLADTASGKYSLAMCYKSSATGSRAVAIGYGAKASGSYSVALGYYTTASGSSSTAMGEETIASRSNSTAMGENTTASGSNSTAMGEYSLASGNNSTAMGDHAEAIGNCSTAMGYQTIASGSTSTAMGYYTESNGRYSTSIGYQNVADADGSVAMGYQTNARGNYSIAMGSRTISKAYASVVLGRYNDTTGTANSWVLTDPVFVIGNGSTSSSRSNSMTVLKNGRIGLQTVISPTYALQLPNKSATGEGQVVAYEYDTYSDSRIKENQASLVYGLNEILKLLPKQYLHHNSLDKSTWVSDNAPKEIGLVAQDVYEIIPEAVNVPENEDTELWGLNYDRFIPILINAVKEQQQQIESYKFQLQALREEVEQIKALLAIGEGE